MREMSVTEQRYKAVLAVIADGRTVGEVAGGCVNAVTRFAGRQDELVPQKRAAPGSTVGIEHVRQERADTGPDNHIVGLHEVFPPVSAEQMCRKRSAGAPRCRMYTGARLT